MTFKENGYEAVEACATEVKEDLYDALIIE